MITISSNTAKQCKYKTPQRTNLLKKKSYNISSEKVQKSKTRKENQPRKTNKQTIITTTKKQAKNPPKNPKVIFLVQFSEWFFTSNLPASLSSEICFASTIHLIYGMMLSIMCHFFVKTLVFIEFVKAISFSILFIFRISAMRLFKFMNFFFWTYTQITGRILKYK